MLRFFCFLSFVLFFTSCQSDPFVSSSLHSKLAYDVVYKDIIKQKTKYQHVTNTFQTVYKLSVTQMGEEVSSVFDERFEKLFSRKQDVISLKENEVTFFVSVFSPNHRESDLGNKHEWFLTLRVDGENFPLERVVRLKNPRLWENFFPFVTSYSKQFLISFKRKSPEKKGEEVLLTLSNSRAKTAIHFK